MTWEPLLGADSRERALEIVGSIAAELRAHFGAAVVPEAEAWSLAAGRSGVALFFGVLRRGTRR